MTDIKLEGIIVNCKRGSGKTSFQIETDTHRRVYNMPQGVPVVNGNHVICAASVFDSGGYGLHATVHELQVYDMKNGKPLHQFSR